TVGLIRKGFTFTLRNGVSPSFGIPATLVPTKALPTEIKIADLLCSTEDTRFAVATESGVSPRDGVQHPFIVSSLFSIFTTLAEPV
ncbi:hypothetical protein N9L81_05040, partial [Planktomarina temperata]|nr:hypothetical protein [Planktomarina temperata]